MPGWKKTAADRERDAREYGTPQYRRTRELVRQRANGKCEKCGHRHPRLQFDAKIPVTQGGTHSAENGWMLCVGEGSCKCHEKKTAQEGGGYRANRGSQVPRDPEPRPRTNW